VRRVETVENLNSRAVLDTLAYVESAALVATTEHTVACETERTADVMEHPVPEYA
jgi:hypothetical protein